MDLSGRFCRSASKFLFDGLRSHFLATDGRRFPNRTARSSFLKISRIVRGQFFEPFAYGIPIKPHRSTHRYGWNGLRAARRSSNSEAAISFMMAYLVMRRLPIQPNCEIWSLQSRTLGLHGSFRRSTSRGNEFQTSLERATLVLELCASPLATRQFPIKSHRTALTATCGACGIGRAAASLLRTKRLLRPVLPHSTPRRGNSIGCFAPRANWPIAPFSSIADATMRFVSPTISAIVRGLRGGSSSHRASANSFICLLPKLSKNKGPIRGMIQLCESEVHNATVEGLHGLRLRWLKATGKSEFAMRTSP